MGLLGGDFSLYMSRVDLNSVSGGPQQGLSGCVDMVDQVAVYQGCRLAGRHNLGSISFALVSISFSERLFIPDGRRSTFRLSQAPIPTQSNPWS